MDHNKSLNSSAMDQKVDWSQLPIELWPKIGKYLDHHIDVLRFRSVCKLFRSSIPPSLPNSPSFPLQIPHPLNISLNCYLYQSTVYLIEPTYASSNSNLAPSSSAPSSSSKGWLIKVQESKNQPLSLLSPISDRKLSYPLTINNTSLMPLNLLNYRAIQLCKSYTIEKPTRFSSSVNKVVFYPNSPWNSVEDCVSCYIFEEGKLGFMKHRDKKWKLLDDKNFYYDDVIVFKGQFYVTDKWGTISWIDVSCMKLIQFSPPLCGFGNKKYLVESCESLYVVDGYYESENTRRNYGGRQRDGDEVVESFKIYKLDEEWGRWVDVKNLSDRAFILSKSCNFSVSTKELIGYEGNCIYFMDSFDVLMYNMDDRKIRMVDFNPCIDKTLWCHAPWLRC